MAVLFFNTCYSIPLSELILLVYSSLSNSVSFICICISFYYVCVVSMYSIILTAMSFLVVWIMELMYSIYCVYDEYYDCIFFFTICLHGLHVVLGYGGFSMMG